MIRALCPRVAVMYLGRIVEQGPTEVFAQPRHPYAQALIDAIPVPEARQPERRIVLQGDIPSPIDLPRGCAFASRCPQDRRPLRRDAAGSATRGRARCAAICTRRPERVSLTRS